MKLPTLYKRTSTGAMQEWTVQVEGNRVFTRFGQTGGAIQETAPTECHGKNIGKANETSNEQQAELEARAQWEKKLKRGYVRTADTATHGAASDLVEGGEWPMLARSYSKDGAKIAYPAALQAKLDGHRAVAIVKDGKCTLWSRSRKLITGVPHIAASFEKLGKDLVADGELYHPDYRDKFDELSHFIRQKTPVEGHEIVQFHCFDLINSDPFSKRAKAIAKLKLKDPLVPVETIEVSDEDEAMLAFERFRAEGFEGVMLRNLDGLYLNHPTHRSYDLQKIKEMDDAEFPVVDVKEGKGKMAGHAIFVIRTKPGVTTDAKMKGELEKLKEYWLHPDRAIGRLLTVQFQGYTKDGRLRFPVALRFAERL